MLSGLLKQIKTQNKDITGDPCIKNDQGSLVFNDAEKLKAWKEHYQRLLNEDFSWDSNNLDVGVPKEGPAPWINKEVVRVALQKLKDGKAACASGILAEMLKASGEAGLDLFTELFSSIVRLEKVPSDWDIILVLSMLKIPLKMSGFTTDN